jgi:hypothetical protein
MQHVHVRWGGEQGRLHCGLSMAQDEVAHSPLGIVVPPVVLLIPSGFAQSIVAVGEDVVLDVVRSGNLIGSDAVEQLFHLANAESHDHRQSWDMVGPLSPRGTHVKPSRLTHAPYTPSKAL